MRRASAVAETNAIFRNVWEEHADGDAVGISEALDIFLSYSGDDQVTALRAAEPGGRRGSIQARELIELPGSRQLVMGRSGSIAARGCAYPLPVPHPAARGGRPIGGLSHSHPPAPPSSGTIGPALAAAPAGATLSEHKVVGCQFMAIAAAAWRQDGLADALEGEKRKY